MKCIQIIKQDKEKTIKLVEENNTKYIQKELKFYDINLYRQLQTIQSPNLPKIYLLQESNNKLTILEEYIDGETLENKQFDDDEIKNILHQLCQCLSILHNQNPPIIHRDIKPENILYHNQIVTLIDFNIAKFQDFNKSKDTQILGSVGYAAPEQYGFEQSNPQTDIYALGKLINVLSTKNLDDIENIPKQLHPIVKKATQLDYRNRYKTVTELDRALQGKSIIIPGIIDENKHNKIISWIWILIFLWIVSNMKDNHAFKNYPITLLSAFFAMYLILIIHFNKPNLIQYKFFEKYWILFSIFLYLGILAVSIFFFNFLDSFL